MSDLSDFSESDFDKATQKAPVKKPLAAGVKSAKEKEISALLGKKEGGSKDGAEKEKAPAAKPEKKVSKKRTGISVSDHQPALDKATGVLSPPEFFISKIVHDAQCFTPKLGHSVVEANGLIYIFGGQNEENSTSALIKFNPTDNSFELVDTTGESPGPRRGATLNIWKPHSRADTSLLLFGGLDEDQRPSNEAWALDIKSLAWKELKLKGSPEARSSHAAVFFEKESALYIFGGQIADGSVLQDAYVLRGTTWSRLKSASDSLAPPGRCCHSASLCTVDRKAAVAIFGGDLTGFGRGDNELWLYYIDDDEWEKIDDAVGETPCPRWKHATAFFDNRLWVMGGTYAGWFKNYVMSDFFVFDFLARCWFKCDIDPKDLGYHTDIGSLTLLPASRAIFIFGGANQNGSPTADVYRLAPVCTTISLNSLRQEMTRTVMEVKQVRSDMDAALQETKSLKEVVAGVEGSCQNVERRLQEVSRTAGEAENKLKDLTSATQALQETVKRLEESMNQTEASIRSFSSMEKKFGIMEVTIQEALAKLEQKADISSLRAVAAKVAGATVLSSKMYRRKKSRARAMRGRPAIEKVEQHHKSFSTQMQQIRRLLSRPRKQRQRQQQQQHDEEDQQRQRQWQQRERDDSPLLQELFSGAAEAPSVPAPTECERGNLRSAGIVREVYRDLPSGVSTTPRSSPVLRLPLAAAAAATPAARAAAARAAAAARVATATRAKTAAADEATKACLARSRRRPSLHRSPSTAKGLPLSEAAEACHLDSLLLGTSPQSRGERGGPHRGSRRTSRGTPSSWARGSRAAAGGAADAADGVASAASKGEPRAAKEEVNISNDASPFLALSPASSPSSPPPPTPSPTSAASAVSAALAAAAAAAAAASTRKARALRDPPPVGRLGSSAVGGKGPCSPLPAAASASGLLEAPSSAAQQQKEERLRSPAALPPIAIPAASSATPAAAAGAAVVAVTVTATAEDGTPSTYPQTPPSVGFQRNGFDLLSHKPQPEEFAASALTPPAAAAPALPAVRTTEPAAVPVPPSSAVTPSDSAAAAAVSAAAAAAAEAAAAVAASRQSPRGARIRGLAADQAQKQKPTLLLLTSTRINDALRLQQERQLQQQQRQQDQKQQGQQAQQLQQQQRQQEQEQQEQQRQQQQYQQRQLLQQKQLQQHQQRLLQQRQAQEQQIKGCYTIGHQRGRQQLKRGSPSTAARQTRRLVASSQASGARDVASCISKQQQQQRQQQQQQASRGPLASCGAAAANAAVAALPLKPSALVRTSRTLAKQQLHQGKQVEHQKQQQHRLSDAQSKLPFAPASFLLVQQPQQQQQLMRQLLEQQQTELKQRAIHQLQQDQQKEQQQQHPQQQPQHKQQLAYLLPEQQQALQQQVTNQLLLHQQEGLQHQQHFPQRLLQQQEGEQQQLQQQQQQHKQDASSRDKKFSEATNHTQPEQHEYQQVPVEHLQQHEGVTQEEMQQPWLEQQQQQQLRDPAPVLHSCSSQKAANPLIVDSWQQARLAGAPICMAGTPAQGPPSCLLPGLGTRENGDVISYALPVFQDNHLAWQHLHPEYLHHQLLQQELMQQQLLQQQLQQTPSQPGKQQVSGWESTQPCGCFSSTCGSSCCCSLQACNLTWCCGSAVADGQRKGQQPQVMPHEQQQQKAMMQEQQQQQQQQQRFEAWCNGSCLPEAAATIYSCPLPATLLQGSPGQRQQENVQQLEPQVLLCTTREQQQQHHQQQQNLKRWHSDSLGGVVLQEKTGVAFLPLATECFDGQQEQQLSQGHSNERQQQYGTQTHPDNQQHDQRRQQQMYWQQLEEEEMQEHQGGGRQKEAQQQQQQQQQQGEQREQQQQQKQMLEEQQTQREDKEHKPQQQEEEEHEEQQQQQEDQAAANPDAADCYAGSAADAVWQLTLQPAEPPEQQEKTEEGDQPQRQQDRERTSPHREAEPQDSDDEKRFFLFFHEDPSSVLSSTRQGSRSNNSEQQQEQHHTQQQPQLPAPQQGSAAARSKPPCLSVRPRAPFPSVRRGQLKLSSSTGAPAKAAAEAAAVRATAFRVKAKETKLSPNYSTR
ncbi:hypothetical protein ACSSS7_004884 [Eimeria intestinalis]